MKNRMSHVFKISEKEVDNKQSKRSYKQYHLKNYLQICIVIPQKSTWLLAGSTRLMCYQRLVRSASHRTHYHPVLEIKIESLNCTIELIICIMQNNQLQRQWILESEQRKLYNIKSQFKLICKGLHRMHREYEWVSQIVTKFNEETLFKWSF